MTKDLKELKEFSLSISDTEPNLTPIDKFVLKTITRILEDFENRINELEKK